MPMNRRTFVTSTGIMLASKAMHGMLPMQAKNTGSKPDHTLRMHDLASLQRFSQSRLTHAISRLERDGYVERHQCESDRRGQYAVLTPAGMTALRAAAPGHVAEVRRRVFDRLTPAQVDALADVCDTLLRGLDPPVACPERAAE